MSGLDATGLTIKTQAEIEADLQTAHRDNISPTIDVSPSSPDGLRIGIMARALALAWEAIEAVYAAIDPDAAEDDALDRIGDLTGSKREAATASRVTCTCDLDAGSYAEHTLVAHVVGFPERRFQNAAAVTSSGGSTSVVFEAQELGPVAAPAGTLTEIASPVSGWHSVTNAADAALGVAIESNTAYRIRRAEEVSAPGSASVNGIAARVLRDVPAVEVCYVIENDTDLAGSGFTAGIGAHGIQVIAHGPSSPTADDDQAVAKAIFRARAAGIKTYGSTAVNVTDDFGFVHAVRFTRPSEQATDVAITLVKDANTYPGDDAVKAAIAAISPLRPGLDVAWAACVAAAMSVPGVLRVTTVTLDALGAFTDKSISNTQFATIASADVTVTSSSGSP